MDHGAPRGRRRSRAEIEAVDLGNEPPLFVDGESPEVIDRRRVSVQWFAGTILTALCGAALMGGAVYAALDRQSNFAAVPEQVEAGLRGHLGTAERFGSGARKADRLPAVGETAVARQVIRVPTTSRVGDREVVRMRQFVRVMSNLALSASELSADIPPFDPRKLLISPGPETAAAEGPPGTEPDADVTFVMRDLSAVLPTLRSVATAPMERVIASVREASAWSSGVQRGTIPGLGSGTRLAYAAEGSPDPYAGFEARIVPENITLLPKTATQTTGGTSWNERTIIVKKGESIGSVLRGLGATPEETKSILNVLGPRGRNGGVKEGQKLKILLSPVAGSKRLQPVRVIVANDTAVEAVVAFSDTGKYVAVDVQSADTQVAEAEEEEDDGTSGVRLYQSVYETALRQRIPRAVIDDLIRIYSYDVDFQRRVQPGDSFEVLYAGDDESASDAKSDILFASLMLGGEVRRFYRFQSLDDGVVDYYDETGKSAKKFLVRKPLGTGIMRSGYGWRRHPILGYSKMHTGVDWAAPFGTPIHAAGNGVIEKAGWESGYGKYVRIRHNNGYQTAYAHMSAFARGIQPGTRVRQGQVIGYVGSTGLSTGAHLHYEVLVNSRYVDPMRIRLPRGRVLEGALLAEFERERERLEAMMNLTPAQVAQTSGRPRR